MLVDTHCHLFNEYYEDIEEVIERAVNDGIGFIIVNGVDRKSNEEILKLVKKYDIVYGALGIQPEEVLSVSDDDIRFVEEHINDEKIVAVGEIGLDYHWDVDKNKQKEVFLKQLEIADKHNKPIIIHSRDCIQETYNILKDYKLKGIMHCYSGSLEMAREFNKLGYLIGIGGVITFKNAVKLIEVVKGIDLDYIVTETDSPYLSPEPYRGKRNESKNIKVIMEKICEIKSISYKELSDVVSSNVLGLFDKNLDL